MRLSIDITPVFYSWITRLNLLILILFVGACQTTQDFTLSDSDERIQVVTTNNIIADWVRVIGGENVDVFSLLPVGADPHTFSPGARDVAHIANADIIITVGLGLEAYWVENLLESASVDSSEMMVLGEFVEPISFTQDLEEHSHTHSRVDPHFWMDPLRVKLAVSAIAAELSVEDSSHQEIFEANSSAYKIELAELHHWIIERVNGIAPSRKVLITSHDSLGYFAERYGFEIAGTVIKDYGAERRPTAIEMANLQEIVFSHNVSAIFGETTVSPRFSEILAQETGASVFRLYSGSLGPPGGESDTYSKMFRTNVDTIVDALK